jgi:hypothetical protein
VIKLDISSISAIVAAIGVLVGVALTVLELRDFVKTRQTDLVMKLYSTFGSREFLEASARVHVAAKDYESFLNKHGWTDVIQVGTFYEGIGVLLNRRLIDIDLVDKLFSEPIKFTWKSMKPIIDADRKRYNSPRMFEWFEYLWCEIREREQQLVSKTA